MTFGLWECGSMHPKSSDVTHSLVCQEIRIDSGVTILNVFSVKKWFRVLRSRMGGHLLLGFGNSVLKKAREDQIHTNSIACF